MTLEIGIEFDYSVVAALAMGSREPGQALTGAAISGVPLCEGRRHRVVNFWMVLW